MNAVLVSESGCAASTYANDRLSLIQASGKTTVLAGGAQGYRDGVGEDARFRHIAGVATTPDGSVAYVADMGNNCIRKVVIATGAVTTVAGVGHDAEFEAPGGHKDGAVGEARFWHPEGLVRDACMHLYCHIYLFSGMLKVMLFMLLMAIELMMTNEKRKKGKTVDCVCYDCLVNVFTVRRATACVLT